MEAVRSNFLATFLVMRVLSRLPESLNINIMGDKLHSQGALITRDDVVSQRLKFGSAFLSSSWKSKIALFF